MLDEHVTTRRISRRSFIRITSAGCVFLACRTYAGPLPRVAVVFNNAPSSGIAEYPYYKAFMRGLRERGLEEDRNIVVVRRSADGQYDRLPRLMQELVSASVDVIVANGPGAGAAWRVTRTVPIVAVATDGLVESGAVAALDHPGGNVTGLTGVGGAGMAAKRLQLLHEAAPGASRIAVLGYGLQSLDPSSRASLESAARALGLTVVWAYARSPLDFSMAFDAIDNERADALYVEAQAATYRHIREIVRLAGTRKIPSVYEFREGPEQGGLMSYGADLSDLFARSATFVDKILNGTKASDLPVQQPIKFDLVINRASSKVLGITIPRSLLTRAEVI